MDLLLGAYGGADDDDDDDGGDDGGGREGAEEEEEEGEVAQPGAPLPTPSSTSQAPPAPHLPQATAVLVSSSSSSLPVTKRRRSDRAEEDEEGDEDDETKKKRKKMDRVTTAKKKERRGTTKPERTGAAVRLPPPPADLFGEEEQDEDKEGGGAIRAAHLGRVRTFPHVEGNYPTFVYIPVYVHAVEGLHDCTHALLDQFRAWLPGRTVYPITQTREDDDKGNAGSSTPSTIRPLELIYHVSISRTVGVRQHQIEPLIELLRGALSQEESFEASFGACELFTNDERTRSFFSLSVIEGNERIRRLIAKVDEVFKQFRLPVYYEDPRPHMTIGWTLGDVASHGGDDPANKIPAALRAGRQCPLGSDIGGPFRFHVRNVQCTPGRNIYDFPLRPVHVAT